MVEAIDSLVCFEIREGEAGWPSANNGPIFFVYVFVNKVLFERKESKESPRQLANKFKNTSMNYVP